MNDLLEFAASYRSQPLEKAPSAIVVGGGMGGIASALRLRAKGYRVCVFERGSRMGGRAQVFERDGFRHDAGPAVITAPFLLEDLFQLFGKRLGDYVTLIPLSPWYRFWFSGQSSFDYGGPLESTMEAMARFDAGDAARFPRLLDHSRQLFETGFTGEPAGSARAMMRQMPRLIGLGAHRTVWHTVCQYVRHPQLRQALSVQSLLTGANPFQTSSLHGLVHYLEYRWGVHFAMGGTSAVIDALTRLMLEEGIDIRLNTTVSKIAIEGGKVKGVELERGGRVAAGLVISNADPMHLYGAMVPERAQALSTRLKRRTAGLSMGLFVLYFGTTRSYPQVAHRTVWFGRRYRELLGDICKRRILSNDFILFVDRPAATDKSFAPPRCESFRVVCPVPNLRGNVNWEFEAKLLRDRIVAVLDRTMLPGLKDCIVSDFFMTPQDFRGRYLSVAGAGFSAAPHFTQSGWLRFHNRAEGIEGLYLTGAGTHPGAGLPGVLRSAKVVDRLVPAAREWGRR